MKHKVHESVVNSRDLDPREVIFVDEDGKEFRGQLVDHDDIESDAADVSVYNRHGRLLFAKHARLIDGKWHGATPTELEIERKELRAKIATLQAQLDEKGG